MAESSFPGTNPFAAGGGGGGPTTSPRQAQGMGQLREEDEMDSVQSPTSGGQPFEASPFTAGADRPFGSSFNPSSAQSSFQGSGGDPSEFPANYAMGRRTSVSAESMNPTASSTDGWTPPSHPKSPEQVSRLKTAVASNFLFSHLAVEQSDQVLGALVEKPIPAKDIKVISQGDAGDFFYVVERGTFDVYIHPSGSIQAGTEGLGNKVASIGPGGSFGELALMYNAPRAATVISTEAGSLLWALDRITFRRILMDAAFQRRRMYESFLEEVPLLNGLTAYERSKIADALETRRFPASATIIQEGDIGEAFYLLEEGEAQVFKRESGDAVVHTYHKGDYFGELALLDDKPRAASVVSVGEVKVASLGKEGFSRLLGPVEERMRENDPSKRSARAGQAPGAAVTAGAGTQDKGVDPLSK